MAEVNYIIHNPTFRNWILYGPGINMLRANKFLIWSDRDFDYMVNKNDVIHQLAIL